MALHFSANLSKALYFSPKLLQICIFYPKLAAIFPNLCLCLIYVCLLSIVLHVFSHNIFSVALHVFLLFSSYDLKINSKSYLFLHHLIETHHPEINSVNMSHGDQLSRQRNLDSLQTSVSASSSQAPFIGNENLNQTTSFLYHHRIGKSFDFATLSLTQTRGNPKIKKRSTLKNCN